MSKETLKYLVNKYIKDGVQVINIDHDKFEHNPTIENIDKKWFISVSNEEKERQYFEITAFMKSSKSRDCALKLLYDVFYNNE